MVTVFPGIEKYILISLVKGNEEIYFNGYFPINGKMYGRLFDQIISTIKFTN